MVVVRTGLINYGGSKPWDQKVMDWTEEREAFFRNLGLAMETLVKQLHEFMGEPKKLAMFISKGMNFLPAPK